MHALLLAIRAIWWRRGLSLTMLLVATCAITASVLGPMYGRAAEESMLQDRLVHEPLAQTGISLEQNNVQFAGVGADEMLAAVRDAASDRSFAAAFGPPRLMLRTQPDVAIAGSGAQPATVATARVLWHEDQCRGVVVVTGACPRAGEAMVSEAAARQLGRRVGAALTLSAPQAPGTELRLRISGVYRPDPASPVWFSANYFDGSPTVRRDEPPRVDSVLVDRPTMLSWPGAAYAVAELPLRPARVRLDDLPRLLAGITSAQQRLSNPVNGRGVGVNTSLPSIVESLAGDRRAVRTSAALATVQLVVLTWFVLYLVVAHAIEQRAHEIALAKLRGLTPAGTAAFGLAEPLLLQLLALPAGLGLGYLAARGMTDASLLPGTPVAIRVPALLAAIGAAMGAAAAAGLAARSLLTRPVLEQLAGDGDPTGRVRRPVVVDGVIAAMAAAGVYQLTHTARGAAAAGDALALLTPGLLALALGLLGARLVPLLSRPALRRTAASDGITGFLAARAVARRPAALRLVVLLCAAAALATFALDAWQVGNRNRALLAGQRVGADAVVSVRAPTTAALLAAVRAADPTGRQAMAAVELIPGGSAPRVLAVDSTRLAAVAAWDASWADRPLADLARTLHPAAPPPVVLAGQSVAVTVTAEAVPRQPTFLELTVQTQVGRVAVNLGRIRAGRQTLQATLPGCAAGCRLTQVAVQRALADFDPIIGAFVVTGIRTDRGPVDAGLDAPARWGSVPVDPADPTREPPASVTASAAGLQIEYGTSSSDVPAVAPVDAPAILPALVPASDDLGPVPGRPGAAYGVGLDQSSTLVTPVARPQVLPRIGHHGQLVDLEYAERLARDPDTQVRQEVWLAPSADPAVLDRLAAAGIRPGPAETAAGVRALLEREGPALALRLFLAAAVAGVLLALAAAGTVVYVAAWHRSYEMAALRALGVPARALTRAGSREQTVLLGGGILLGAVAGLTAAWLALPAYPLTGDRGDGPPLALSPAYLPIGALLAAVLVLAMLVAHVGARSIVRAGEPARLRETRG